MTLYYAITFAISLLMLAVCFRIDRKRDRWLRLLFIFVAICNGGYLCLSLSRSLTTALLSNTIAYLEKYAELLDVVRSYNPDATVISLSAFCGAHHAELGEMIARYNEKNGCHVYFIDSNGWISPEPLHPLRDGHTTVASRLIPLLREIMEANR